MAGNTFDQSYWEERWKNQQTGWDIGYASHPITSYFDQVEDKSLNILIPGCGNAYEGEHLHKEGFTNVYLLDLAPTSLANFQKRVPDFPAEHLILGDFFELDRTFDIIVEQTFFCALHPHQRDAYVKQAHKLLNPGGKLVGVLFNDDFGKDTPPFGGTREEYLTIFGKYFDVRVCETAHNSITPRSGRELFIVMQKPA